MIMLALYCWLNSFYNIIVKVFIEHDIDEPKLFLELNDRPKDISVNNNGDGGY